MTDRSNLAAIVALVWVFLLDGCGDAIQKRRHELCTFALANRQLDPSAKIDGRIAVVYLGGGYDPKFDNGCDIDGYSGGYKAEPRYFPVQMYAQSPDEIDTLVIIALRKGDFIKTTNFQMTQSVGWTTDVYAGQLVISVINFKTSTLVQNSVRAIDKIPDKIEAKDLIYPKRGAPDHAEYVVEPKIDDIRSSLREFSTDVRND